MCLSFSSMTVVSVVCRLSFVCLFRSNSRAFAPLDIHLSINTLNALILCLGVWSVCLYIHIFSVLLYSVWLFYHQSLVLLHMYLFSPLFSPFLSFLNPPLIINRPAVSQPRARYQLCHLFKLTSTATRCDWLSWSSLCLLFVRILDSSSQERKVFGF